MQDLQGVFSGSVRGSAIPAIPQADPMEKAARQFGHMVAAGMLRMQAGIYVDAVLGETRDVDALVRKAYLKAMADQALGISAESCDALSQATRYCRNTLSIGDVVLGQDMPALSYKPTKIFKAAPDAAWQESLKAFFQQLNAPRLQADPAAPALNNGP